MVYPTGVTVSCEQEEQVWRRRRRCCSCCCRCSVACALPPDPLRSSPAAALVLVSCVLLPRHLWQPKPLSPLLDTDHRPLSTGCGSLREATSLSQQRRVSELLKSMTFESGLTPAQRTFHSPFVVVFSDIFSPLVSSLSRLSSLLCHHPSPTWLPPCVQAPTVMHRRPARV